MTEIVLIWRKTPNNQSIDGACLRHLLSCFKHLLFMFTCPESSIDLFLSHMLWYMSGKIWPNLAQSALGWKKFIDQGFFFFGGGGGYRKDNKSLQKHIFNHALWSYKHNFVYISVLIRIVFHVTCDPWAFCQFFRFVICRYDLQVHLFQFKFLQNIIFFFFFLKLLLFFFIRFPSVPSRR